MDIQRGSRRARHVAANTAANQAAQATQQQQRQQQQQQEQQQRQQRQQQHQHPPPTQGDGGLRAGLLRPAPQARDMHRTPDQRQPESDDEHQMPTVAPRVNPFRLHRYKPASSAAAVTMPRTPLQRVSISRSGAVIRRSSSPVPRYQQESQQDGHDAEIPTARDASGRMLRRVRRLSADIRARLGGSVRRRLRGSSAPPPPGGQEQEQEAAEELETETEDRMGMDLDFDDSLEYFAEADMDYDAATRGTTTPRLSMPLGSDDASDSEPDLSVLAMARGAGRGAQATNTTSEQMLIQQQEEAMAYEDEVMSQEQYEAEETSIDEQVEEEEEEQEEPEVLVDPASIGLKEISNLGKFTVSSHKLGNGVQELRSDDLKLYWQSDGPQPHKLTIYFIKRVGIRVIRFFVDYQEDESYTPTKIAFKSGTSENNMIEFATMTMENPYGWQEVPIAGAGGEPDGNTLVSYVLQMQILENHQNGKDTHLRGIKIYAFDPDSGQQAGGRGQQHQNPEEIAQEVAEMVAGSKLGDELAAGGSSGERLSDMARILASSRLHAGESAFSAADFLREPELR